MSRQKARTAGRSRCRKRKPKRRKGVSLMAATDARYWTHVLIAAVLLLPLQAIAQQPDVVLKGTAQTGSDSRAVQFRFACSANNGPNLTGVLSVELEVPQAEQLSKLFDFEPFEGPDANAGALSHLEATGAKTKAQADFTAAGS